MTLPWKHPSDSVSEHHSKSNHSILIDLIDRIDRIDRISIQAIPLASIIQIAIQVFLLTKRLSLRNRWLVGKREATVVTDQMIGLMTTTFFSHPDHQQSMSRLAIK